MTNMTKEMRQLIENAAKLLGLELIWDGVCPPYFQTEIGLIMFNPLDPERGDLMKLAMAAGLSVEFDLGLVFGNTGKPDSFAFTKDDHQSLAIAVLRAVSAVLRSRGGV